MIKKFPQKFQSGFSLLEIIFYISFLAVLSIVIINSLIIMAKSFKEIAIQAELVQGSDIVEKISREIRQSLSINTISTNDLKINTTDDNDVNKTVEFVLDTGNIKYLENNLFTGNLNSTNITVNNLTFTSITTTKSKAVKILLTVSSNRDPLGRTYDFYDTVVLRGSYQ